MVKNKNNIYYQESENVELKSSLSLIKEIIESISAFSNTSGGTIVIGVNNSGKVLGLQIGKNTIEHLTNKIAQNTEPKIHPKIKIEKIRKSSIIIIEVHESLNKTVLAFGKPFKRVGKSTVKMSRDEYEKSILEKHQFDSMICEEANIEDLDKKKVNWYLKKREKIRKIKKPRNMSYEKLLSNVKSSKKIGRETIPTNAGVLFFGKYPKKFFIQSQLRIAKFKGIKVTHPVIDRLDLAGTLWEMIDEAEDFIRKSIRLLSFRTDKSFMREDKFEYPIKALREAMINALIHRDYREPSDTRVFIFDDRIEIINPGNFPRGISPKRPMHKAVNPILCDLMYDIGFIEKYGSGIYMMNELCKDWGNKKPYYELHPIQTKIVFESQIKESTVIEVKDELLKELNDRQKKAIEYMRQKGSIRRREYVRINKISHTIASRELKHLFDINVVQKIGKGKYLKYRLTQG